MSAARETAAADPRIADVVRALGLGAVRLTELAAGASNVALRLEGTDRDVVLRLAGPESARLGAAADAELAMQRLAAGVGLAPDILLAWPDRGVLVTQHVRGKRPESGELREPAALARIARWFRTLHELEPPRGLAAIDFGERAAGYLATLRAAGDTSALGDIAGRLRVRIAALGPPPRRVPCHHDLHAGNLIVGRAGIVALDWEYAGPGDAAADLAAHAGYQALDDGQLAALLAAYGADAELRARVAACAWVFDCLWYGWQGVARLAGLAGDRAHADALEARLLG